MIHGTGIEDRVGRVAAAEHLAYQKALLAVYLLADEAGLSCEATDAEIGRQSGLGVGPIGLLLSLMRDRGDVRVFGKGDGLACRVIVLADHPEAEDLAILIGKIARRGRSR
jgi:hypothetical protein